MLDLQTNVTAQVKFNVLMLTILLNLCLYLTILSLSLTVNPDQIN